MRALVLCLLVACGDNAARPDGSIDAVDAAPDAPTPPPGCDFGELADVTNNMNPEPTGLAFNDPLVICGSVDPGHFIPMTNAVDDDVYGFTLPAATNVKVEVMGLGGFDRVEVSIVNGFGDPIATSVQSGNHAVAAASVPAGGAGIAIRVFGAEPALAIGYVARVTRETPCGAATPSYTESSAANDVIEVRYTSEPHRMLTAAADAPETTGLTVTSAAVAITGVSANVDAADDFRDRDTFEITTGAIDEMSVSLQWTTTDTDFDLFVFPENTPSELAAATHVSPQSPEAVRLAVLPNTRYWLWVGAHDSSAILPRVYAMSLCGE